MSLEIIQNKIYQIRGERVMLDFDLAEMYGVETKRLKEQVRRNIDRFPDDFMFELKQDEFQELRSQTATSKKGGTRYMPFAFTEQGVSMLSSVLNSKKAIAVNISIIRAFVMLRQHLADYKDLKAAISALEIDMNTKFKDINQALHYLLNKEHEKNQQHTRKRIGFKNIKE